MAQIELTQNESDMLRGILQKSLSEISLEIAFSDRKDFREFLKKRKEFMEGFVQRLESELASARRQGVNMERLRKVDILQGLMEGRAVVLGDGFVGNQQGKHLRLRHRQPGELLDRAGVVVAVAAGVKLNGQIEAVPHEVQVALGGAGAKLGFACELRAVGILAVL